MAASPSAYRLLCALGAPLGSCADRSPVAPTDDTALLKSGPVRSSSNPVERQIKADCTTTITFIDPGSAGQCAVFQPVPSAFIAIGGRCETAHLGRMRSGCGPAVGVSARRHGTASDCWRSTSGDPAAQLHDHDRRERR